MIDAVLLLELLRQWGYVIVFLAGVAEAVPFLGMLVPGQAVIVLAGVLAAQGVLDLEPVIIAAILAGVFGDAIGYYLGRWRGRELLLRFGPRVRLEEKHVQRADALFQRYGAVALVLARFSFLTRGLASLLAGTHRLRQGIFWPLNLAGAVVWGLGYTLLGYLFGGSIEVLEGLVGPTLAFTGVALLALFVLYRVLKKISAGFTLEDAALPVLAGVAGTLFALLAERAQDVGPVALLDAGWLALANALTTWASVGFWDTMSFLGSAWVLAPATVGAALGFAWRRQWWDAFLFAVGVGGERVLTSVLKVLFARPRPEDALVTVQFFAFPSAHAASSLVFAGAVVYVMSRRYVRGWPQAVLIAGGILFTLLVGVSRIALRVHYPSDVLGGWLLGAAWLFTTLLVVEAWYKTRRARVTTAAGKRADAASSGDAPEDGVTPARPPARG